MPILVMCTPCVAACTVMTPVSASWLATMARPSIGTFWWRCTSMWNSSTRSAPANVPATSPNSVRLCGPMMLSSRLANSGGLPASRAAAAVATGGRSA